LLLNCLNCFAELALAEQRGQDAARLRGALAAIRASSSLPDLNPPEEFEEDMENIKKLLSEEGAFSRAWQEGEAMSLDEALDFGLRS
jgi:hypothetical protein